MSERNVVFVSWSGHNAKEVALELKALLLLCFDGVDPFMSDDDIKSGTRGLAEIQEALSSSSTAIIVVTRDNVSSPWLNFEAGAISNGMGSGDSRVIPLLVNLGVADIPSGSPLTQFQARRLDDEGLRKVVSDIAIGLGVDQGIALRRSESELNRLVEMSKEVDSRQASEPPAPSTDEMIREVLVTVRSLRREQNENAHTPVPSWERTGPIEIEALLEIPRVLLKEHGLQNVQIFLDGGRVYFSDALTGWAYSLPAAEATEVRLLQRIALEIRDYRESTEGFADGGRLASNSKGSRLAAERARKEAFNRRLRDSQERAPKRTPPPESQ